MYLCVYLHKRAKSPFLQSLCRVKPHLKMKAKNDIHFYRVVERRGFTTDNFLVDIKYPQICLKYNCTYLFFFFGRRLSDHILETQSLVSSHNLPSLQTKGKTYLPCSHLHLHTKLQVSTLRLNFIYPPIFCCISNLFRFE